MIAADDAAPAAAAARPWLARLNPGLFGISLGTLGLAGSWLRLRPFVGHAAQDVFFVLLAVGLATLGLLFALWCMKLLRHFDVVRQEWNHPVQGALLALLPVSTLLAVALTAPLQPDGHRAATLVTLAALAMQAVIAWRVVAELSTARMPPRLVTPALYLPIVPGGLVGAMALDAIGFHGWSALLLGMGVGGWLLLEVRILRRLFSGPLPLALRPTLGIEMSPAAVSTLAAVTLWPDLPADVLIVALGVASGPFVMVLTRWRWWSAVPFSAGFWSFSFPVAALAAVVVEAARRGGWPAEFALGAVAIATLIIGFLAMRTLWLLACGRLLSQ